ncbi:MAG: hypothetical protein OXI91_14115 [Chloroflexota bacterium]|nr:hypothetical protein [Chloroflexota bacterium]
MVFAMTTQQPRHSEPSVNNQLGDLLREMLFGCQVRSENTQLVAGRPGLQLDNLITAPGRAPVVVEAEYEALGTAEGDAAGRLGLPVIGETHPIEAAIALRYPDSVRFADNLRPALAGARLSYAVLYQDGSRFPESGWLRGGVSDLADLIRLVSVPQKAVDAAADALQQGIERAADILGEMAQTRPNITPAIAGLLGMSDVPQTRRMAGAILGNALVFHQRIAGMHDSIRPLRLVCGPDVPNPQSATLDAWKEILDINYWAIFAIARDILTQLPDAYAARILTELRETAQNFDAAGVDHAHDLTGQIFQRLIADRKYLATFYTRPASAALLARMAMSKLEGVDWSDASAIGKLRVGDFACGTGALLSAVYEQVAARHSNAGGAPARLHRAMMEEVLYGCDVMPSAIHITGSTLSGMQPSVGFNQSRLYTMAYGRQSDGSVQIGSLELLLPSEVMTLFNTNDPALRTGSVGEETAAQVNVDIPDAGFDLVIMNPPFTRATNHEGAHADVTNPAFAAFDATEADQTAMGERINQLGKDTCYHGNAGIASAFAALAHRKLKPGGVLALVLPLSAAAGLSWQDFRQLLAQEYSDLEVVSIAANGNEMSFSSDTGMAECLVVARKNSKEGVEQVPARFASLTRRPPSFAHAATLAGNVTGIRNPRGIDDGPYGGSPLSIGDESAGELLAGPVDNDHWSGVRLLDGSLAQTAHALTQSKLWLPGQPSPMPLPVAHLGEVGKLGLVHRDITGPAPRGPFDKVAPSATATYPALWNHDAKQEIRIICEPDSQLRVRQGMEEKAAMVWATASRAHLNLDFTFGSQALSVAFTSQPSAGGRVWPNVTFQDDRFDYAFAIWGNSTLGLLSHWWHSSRQQSSKANMTIRSAENLLVFDLRNLSEAQLETVKAIFDGFHELELQPAYLADADPNRALLDRRVVCDLLGFDGEVYRAVRHLAAKWCAEPSVHGGKRRPTNARYVE